MAKRKSVGARFIRGVQVGGTTTPTKAHFVTQRGSVTEERYVALYTRPHGAREIDLARTLGLI